MQGSVDTCVEKRHTLECNTSDSPLSSEANPSFKDTEEKHLINN